MTEAQIRRLNFLFMCELRPRVKVFIDYTGNIGYSLFDYNGIPVDYNYNAWSYNRYEYMNPRKELSRQQICFFADRSGYKYIYLQALYDRLKHDISLSECAYQRLQSSLS